MKELISKLRAKTTKDVDNLEFLLEKYSTEHPVINRLLNLPDQVLYNLTETSKNNVYSVCSLVHSLHHAFVDDGDWSIVRKKDQDLVEMYERLKIEDREPCWQYSIKSGDWTCTNNVEAICLLEEDWDEIIDTYMLHIDFYEANKDAVNNHEESANDKYWDLLGKSDELYAKWFKQRF